MYVLHVEELCSLRLKKTKFSMYDWELWLTPTLYWGSGVVTKTMPPPLRRPLFPLLSLPPSISSSPSFSLSFFLSSSYSFPELRISLPRLSPTSLSSPSFFLQCRFSRHPFSFLLFSHFVYPSPSPYIYFCGVISAGCFCISLWKDNTSFVCLG